MKDFFDNLFFKYTKDPERKYVGNTIIGDLVGASIFIGGGTLVVWIFYLFF